MIKFFLSDGKLGPIVLEAESEQQEKERNSKEKYDSEQHKTAVLQIVERKLGKPHKPEVAARCLALMASQKR